MKQTIAIIGAGMNGLALALSLRLFGIEAKIYEQAEAPRVDGTGICVWSEGMQILAALTNAADIKRIGNAGILFDTCTATGEHINQMELFTLAPYSIAPMGMFHRCDIYRLLLEQWGTNNIHCNKKLIALHDEKEYVEVGFADGTKIQADIVIGADGIYSMVRQQLFPTISLIDSGVKCCRGITEFSTALINDESIYAFSGNKSRIVSYTINRNTQLKYWFVACAIAADKSLQTQEDILKNFAYYHPDLLNMIKQTKDENIIPSTLYELKPMQTWSKGRVTLVGDACCAALPTMAIGFSLGLENSFILAQCLASNYYDIKRAFLRYENRCLIRSNKLLNLTQRLNEIVYKEGVNNEKIGPVYQEFFKYISRSPF